MENPNYYSILTANVRYDDKISSTEKLLYSEITALSNKSGYCNASNKYFAELYGISKETVSRRINNLKERGHIRTEIIYDNKKIAERRIYPIDEKVNTYCRKSQEGIDEKVKENNTSIIINKKKKKEEVEQEKVIEFYNNNITLIANHVYLEIRSYLEDGFEADLIIEAMKEAVERNKRNWKYIKTILNDCDNNNIKTKEQYLVKQKEFKENQTIQRGKNKIQKEDKQEVVYNTDFSQYDKYVKGRDESG